MVNRSRNFERLATLLVVLAITAAGCGPRVKVPTARVSGVVTVNGKGVEGVEVAFVPEAKIRPGIGVTDSNGRYQAQFLERQMGVPLGPCLVQISLYRDDLRANNLIPPRYNEKAADHSDLKLTIPREGATFNFDVKTDKPLP